MHLNTWMPCYDDRDCLRRALESLLPASMSLHVYVVDGRYVTFDGDTDVTPGAEEVCQEYDFVSYHTPPDLPIGDPDVADHLRSPQHEQAKWVNYELLPEGEWAMEMDTDERLERLEVDGLDLNPQRKYSVTVLTPDDEQLEPAIRLYQPQHWTFWIDDVMFYRELYPRSTPLSELFTAHVQTAHRNTGYAGTLDDIVLRNYGGDRPEEYQERRADQLETMGAKWAARAVRDGERPSTVDLREYAKEGEESMQNT